jgi:hypothetical protein
MKVFAIGDTVRFGATRRMRVTATRDNYSALVSQQLTLLGPRGGIARAFVYRSGRILMR